MKRFSRGIAAVVSALTLGLAGCTGLPSTGAVQVGLQLDDVPAPPDVLTIASGPEAGAGPEEIVAGFLNAAISAEENWGTARLYLAPEIAETWSPLAGVTIDASSLSRKTTSSLPAPEEEDGDEKRRQAREDQVVVDLTPTARVDETGAYSELSGNPAQATFSLARNAEGEWRITAADDGIILDEDTFGRVYESHALQYYDLSFTRLIPDLRWYPKRWQLASTLTKALVSGDATPWLAPSVRNAFTEVRLGSESVLVSADQVADVSLSSEALQLSGQELARMRTQLEATLRSVGVSQVRFFVDGSELEAGLFELDTHMVQQGTRVLTDEGFGILEGSVQQDIPGVSSALEAVDQPISGIDVADDGSYVIAQLESGQVYAVDDDRRIEVDARPQLIAPSLDLHGFVWTVPEDHPTELIAWTTDVVPYPVTNAFDGVSAISQLRVAADGSRVAAVVTMGGEQWVAVAAIVRGEGNTPQSLGPLSLLSRVEGTARSLVWSGVDTVAVLVDEGDTGQTMRLQTVGGPTEESRTPRGAVSLAGAGSSAGLMVLTDSGVVYERRPTWQEKLTGVRVLATQSGY